MASGAFIFEGGPLDPIAVKIANANVTIIAGNSQSKIKVPWFSIQENSGGTPTVTVEQYDGTNSVYLGAGGVTYRAKALTANQSVEFTNGYILNVGQYIRITSVTGSLDVTGLSGFVTGTGGV